MGACSSKPKTTEFEDSMEPLTKTEIVSADRSIDAHVDAAQVAERSMQIMTDEPGKEIPVKSEGGVNVSAEVVQEKLEHIAGSEVPLKVDLPTTAEEDGVAEKDGVDDEEEVKDKASPVGVDVGGHSLDGDNICEDKAIVLNEVGNGVVDKGDVYMDKAASLDEDKAHESLDMSFVSTHDIEPSNAQYVTASTGIESPIIGVVQPVEPIHVDDVSDSVGMAIADRTVSDDSTPPVAAEKVIDSSAEIKKEIPAGTSYIVAAKEEGNDISSDLPRGAENAKVSGSTFDDPQPTEDEDLQKGSKVSPHVSEDEVAQENVPNVASGVDPLPETAESNDEICLKGPLEDATKSDTTTEPQTEVDESTSEHPQGKSTSDVGGTGESLVEVTETKGNAQTLGELEVCALKPLEDTDAEIPVIPKVEVTPKEVVDEKVEATPEEVVEEKVEVTPEVTVDEPGVHPQALAVEESVGYAKLEGTSDEAIAKPSAEIEGKEKVEESQAVEAPPAKGELAFEDASDVPLKVESSSAESGRVPASS